MEFGMDEGMGNGIGLGWWGEGIGQRCWLALLCAMRRVSRSLAVFNAIAAGSVCVEALWWMHVGVEDGWSLGPLCPPRSPLPHQGSIDARDGVLLTPLTVIITSIQTSIVGRQPTQFLSRQRANNLTIAVAA